MSQRYEYKVEIIRQSLVGGKVDAPKLEAILNGFAAAGWQAEVDDGDAGQRTSWPGRDGRASGHL